MRDVPDGIGEYISDIPQGEDGYASLMLRWAAA
jgi:hypothetical protein